MPKITIDAHLCKKDGLCAMACTRAIFRQREKGTIPEVVDVERCFGCGHCVAICPSGAISHSDYPKDAVTPVKSEILPSYDQVLELVRSRRAHRLFKDTPVEREVIEKVLDVKTIVDYESVSNLIWDGRRMGFVVKNGTSWKWIWVDEKTGRLKVSDVKIHKVPINEDGIWIQEPRYTFEGMDFEITN